MPFGPLPGGASIGTPPVALTGTPSANQVPKAINATTAAWGDAAGGAGVAQLPVWTYVAGGGAPAAGTFTYNGSNTLRINNTSADGVVVLGDGQIYQAVFTLLMKNTAGALSVFASNGPSTPGAGVNTIAGDFVGTAFAAGNYTFSFFQQGLGDAAVLNVGSAEGDIVQRGASGLITGPGTIQEDTGWSTNAGVGDKTVIVPAYAGGGALFTLDPDADAQLVALTAKFLALETALAAALRPNA